MRMESKSIAVALVNANADVARSCQNESHVMKPLLGHIPQAVQGLADIGKLDEQKVLPVTIALHLNNEAELDARIEDMYNPASPSFHQFLTTEQFNARYAPTDEQVANEKAFLEQNGIAVQSVSDNHVLIQAQSSVETLNHVFRWRSSLCTSNESASSNGKPNLGCRWIKQLRCFA
jgi:subtilase family serine protease